MENNILTFTVNNKAADFYAKWRKDTIQSLTIAPIFFAFFAMLFTMIVGISIKLLFILILPLILTVILFVYIPLIVPKKYMNNLIRSIDIKGNDISINTYNWFGSHSVYETSFLSMVKIKEVIGYNFFRNKRIRELMFKNSGGTTYYIVDEFFDDIDRLLNIIQQ